MATRSQVRTNVLTLFGLVEMVLFSGVIFGWANLLLILKDEEYFKDLCAESHVNMSGSVLRKPSVDHEKCGKQDERLALIFTICVFTFNVAGFIGGIILDKLGTRVVRLLACFFYFLTGLFSFFLEKETANLMFPLLICLSFAGMFVTMTVFQIALLHRKHQFIISSSFSGALDSSSVVFLIFKVVYSAGVGIRWILITYTIMAVVCLSLTTFFLLPKNSIAAEQLEASRAKSTIELDNRTVTPETVGDQNPQRGSNSTKAFTVELGINNQVVASDIARDQNTKNDSYETKATLELGVSNQAITPDTVGYQEMILGSVVDFKDGDNFDDQSIVQSATENGKPNEAKSISEVAASHGHELDKYSSGWRYILTPKYLWLLFYFSLLKLRLWYFVGSLNGYLIYQTDDDNDKIETYSEIFGLVQFFGFIFAPLTGLIMDLKPRNITNTQFGPMLSFILTILLSLVLGGLVLIPVLEVLYFAFAVQVAMRSFLYAGLITYVLRAFPVAHYGKLYGVCTLVGAAITLLQYPAIVLIDGPFNGNPYWVNFGFFVATFTATGLPLYLWLSNRNIEETTSF